MIVERSTRFLGINFHPRQVVGTDDELYEEEFFRFNRHTRRLLGLFGISTPRYVMSITDRQATVVKEQYNQKTGASDNKKERDISHDKVTGEPRTFEFFIREELPPNRVLKA